MEPLRLSSKLAKDAIIQKSRELGFLVLSPAVLRSRQQLALAEELAKRSFSSKTNLANMFELEFLLWLTGERDIRAALKKSDFSPGDFAVVCFKDVRKKSILDSLAAAERPLELRETSTPIEIEETSLSRV